jgi:hypothetical protein
LRGKDKNKSYILMLRSAKSADNLNLKNQYQTPKITKRILNNLLGEGENAKED